MSHEAVLESLRDRVLVGEPVCIRSGGTKDFYGQQLTGEVLDVSGYAGVIAYDPAELVITARCGTPLAEIEKLLATHRQMLPFEPPHFGPSATIGGCIAAGLSGPGRINTGAPRDFVLGAVVMNGCGQVLRFGGQVMKNVAGYDVARLMAGSLGILGILLEVSVKVLPQPSGRATLRFSMDQSTALRRLNEWATLPLPISASAWHSGELHVRLTGAVAAVEKACETLGGERQEERESLEFWNNLREQRLAFFKNSRQRDTLWRCTLPATAASMNTPEDTLIEWHGMQRWIVSTRSADEVRSMLRGMGGHATAFRRNDPNVPAFDALAAPVMAIQRRLKQVFDPKGIFNRNRMYADL